jgi:hypothetical protein
MVPGSGRNWIAVNAVNDPPEQNMKPTETTTPSIKNSVSRAPWRRDLLLIVITCFAALVTVQGAPDGGVGTGSTAEGPGALFSLTSGSYDTAMGLQALFNNTTGVYNTGTGVNALYSNTSGAYNTATGGFALFSNTTGTQNTATGLNALANNTTGSFNTATGVGALNFTAGDENTATGWGALFTNIGSDNTATGFQALFHNFANGNNNTATGAHALESNIFGNDNTATGAQALQSNMGNHVPILFGSWNTATGVQALQSNTFGSFNTALGFQAGKNLTTGNFNIDIGNFDGSSSSDVAGESNTIRLGIQGTQTSTFIAGISGTAVSGVTVVVDANGQLGVLVSSQSFKDEIKSMDKASEAILALRPVTFRYKQEIDPKGIPQFGLVAEEVEKVNPDLVVRNAEGKVYTVRYEAVNAMLLNEFLKEHRKVEEQGAVIAQQQKNFESKIAQQQKQIEALTAVVQKVSAQVEMNRPAPQIVTDNQ